MCEVTVCQRGSELIANLNCELDHHAAKTVRQKIDEELSAHRPECLVLDFSRVPFMDSSGIGLILGRVERAAAVGATVRIRGLSERLMRIIKLSGLERIRTLTVEDSPTKAL